MSGISSRVAILGGGRMGEALAAGLLASGVEPADLAVAEVSDARRAELAGRLAGVDLVPSPADAVPGAGVVVVAVKPPDAVPALTAALPRLDPGALVVSIAAGVRIAALEAAVPGHPVVRAMPNTPALVRRGVAAVAPGSAAGEEHLRAAERVLGAVGVVVRVPEAQLDAVTGVSGSGPAYVFLVAEALVEAAVAVGLPPDVAATLVTQTLLGAATLLVEGHGSPEELRAQVTSPHGTTEAGVRVLEAGGIRATIAEAVAAATRRSEELGGGSTRPSTAHNSEH